MYIPLTFEGALQKCLFASGGIEGTFISGSEQWAYHLFTSSATFEVQKGTLDKVQILVVGGGGGGAYGYPAGAGGAGGVNFQNNIRLFAGNHTIFIGKGGAGGAAAITSDNVGNNGISSSFIGSGLSIVANGGNGGQFGSGLGEKAGNSGAPTSFIGGNNSGTSGGGGGGASANGTNGSTSGGTGGAGLSYYFAGSAKDFGCGGGGSGDATNDNGAAGCASGGIGGDTTSRNTSAVAYYGGGGGGALRGYLTPGGDGGSGSVIIQYPIYDYCSEFFNETGSCDCREVTFDCTDSLNYSPNITGSYLYTPCGTNTFTSGSLKAYFPTTVCAASNSFYWYTDYQGVTQTGFANTGAECSTGSLCVTQSFQPTCSGSYIFYKGGTSSTLYYIPLTSSSFEYTSVGNNIVDYKCISSGSFGKIGYYPYGLSGAGAQLSTSSIDFCTSYTFTPGSGTQTATYYDCKTDTLVSIAISSPTSFCTRNGRPRTISGAGSTIVAGGGCVTNGSGSCGCP